MRSSRGILAAMVAVAFTGCDGNRSRLAVGVYELDKDATEAHLRSLSSSAAWGKGVSMLRQLVERATGSFALAADGSCVRSLDLSGVRQEDRGTWTLSGEKLRWRAVNGTEDVFRLRDGVITTERDLGGMQLVLLFRKVP